MLVNLLGNALKFSPSGGVITVDFKEVDHSVEVTVQDEGPGIPADCIDKVFDRFQQVSKDDSAKRGGSGLGLAICKSLVSAHGGQIGVRSEQQKGSVFWFRIPLPAGGDDDTSESSAA